MTMNDLLPIIIVFLAGIFALVAAVTLLRVSRKLETRATIVATFIGLLGVIGAAAFQGSYTKYDVKKLALVTRLPIPANSESMILIPAGAFLMGCNEQEDRQCSSDEQPAIKVYLKDFEIDKFEVTVDEYRHCVEAGECSSESLSLLSSCGWGKEGRENSPINCVDWHQARQFCTWVDKRLPTEPEWESAARGVYSYIYPWGDTFSANKANVNSGEGPANLGSYPEDTSPYGISGMAGNVSEWVQDWYEAQYYRRAPELNPKGPETGEFKVLRGGSWNNPPEYARVSSRLYAPPDSRYGHVGIRCARNAPDRPRAKTFKKTG